MTGLPNRRRSGRRTGPRAWTVAVTLLAVLGADSAGSVAGSAPAEAEVGDAEDFLIVDCLLPGKVRRLGRRQTYLAARKGIRTTAVDCRIRGGEYTAFDRASYATALKVWLGQAREGAADAQFYVAQIFEQGLGIEPDYGAAAEWYTKAAEQGHSGAQTSLGFLYETGLGVERDSGQALAWYRRAAGLDDALVVLESHEYEELQARRQELTTRTQEVEDLQRRLQEALRELEEQRQQSAEDAAAETRLQSSLDRLQGELQERSGDVERLAREVARLESVTAADTDAGGGEGDPAVDFGPYHALVIGNGAYQKLDPVASAPAEARNMARLLTDRYGFRVRLLVDATRYQILEALNRLREELTERDNLVVFFAGHSEEDSAGQRGWWKPVDADPDSRAQWISHRVLADHLEVLAAKHVLVLADAAYAATLTRSSIPQLPTGMTPERRRGYLSEMSQRRTRLVMAGGGPEAGGSVDFTAALLEVLGENEGVLEASDIYRRVNRRISEGGTPVEFAPIRWSRHEGGSDFFFVAAGDDPTGSR